MAAKHTVTVPAHPINRRPSSAERRAIEAASLSGKQARLKQEATERRAQRATLNAPVTSMPHRTASTRRTAG